MFLLFLFFHFLCLPKRGLAKTKNFTESSTQTFLIFHLPFSDLFWWTASFEQHHFSIQLLYIPSLGVHTRFFIIPCTIQMLSTCWLVCMIRDDWTLFEKCGEHLEFPDFTRLIHTRNWRCCANILSSRCEAGVRKGEANGISPATSPVWGEIIFSFEGFSPTKNIFRALAALFLVICRMIHVYCDLFYLIDFNWLLLVTQTFPSDCIENSSSWFQLNRFPEKKRRKVWRHKQSLGFFHASTIWLREFSIRSSYF